MPVYFAYGSNLDRSGMALRCPGAVPLGLGCCPGHRFFIMAAGYASIRPELGAVVHGLLWSVPDDELPALDDYEEVGAGLYTKATVSVVRPDASSIEALIYVGASNAVGRAHPGYMELVIAAAGELKLPAAYCQALRHWLPTSGARRAL